MGHHARSHQLQVHPSHPCRHRAEARQSNPGLRNDVYARITDEIVVAIEAGPGRWRLPWHHDGGDVARPTNLVSKKRYRGINVLALWVAALKSGFTANIWDTYRQFTNAGGQVREGERATTIVFWKEFRKGDGNGAEDGDESEGRRSRFMARGYSIFNAAQVDGLDLPKPPVLPETERIADAETFFAATVLPIRTEGDQACYRPREDAMLMPAFARFRSADAYYATLAHECAPATGHASRLDRKLDTRFGSNAYAAEEAIAELTASYCMADLGFAYGQRNEDGLQRSAAYIASWLEVLKSDSRAIFTAAAKAQAAADWLHGQQAGPRRSDVGQTDGEAEPSCDDAPAAAVTAEAA
jgi:antirestriction protein ArdC